MTTRNPDVRHVTAMFRNTSKIQLTTVFAVSILIISFLASASLAVFWVGSERRHFQSMAEDMEARYLRSRENLLKSEVDRVIDYLEHEKDQTEARLKAEIRSRVYEAFTIVDGIYRRHKDRVPAEAIKTMVIETLRDMNFNDGRGYFFATDVDGVSWLSAGTPELEGRNLLDQQDAGGHYVIRDMIALTRAKGEGYYRYHWIRPDTEGDGHPKIAFVKYFEPFDWYIGTGEYLQDVEAEIKAKVLEHIERIQFGTDGYIFVGTYEGMSLTKPAKNRNMWEVQDENGVKVVQQLIARARSGGGFVNYVMPKFTGLPSAPKLSYAAPFDSWQWYVGAGMYVDEIDAMLDRNRQELAQNTRNHLIWIGLTLAGIVALTVVAVRVVTQHLQRTIQSFSTFFDKASTEALKIDHSHVHFMEFDRLARSANRMVDERRKADQALNDSLEWNRAIFSSIQSGIVVIDAEAHQVVDINPSAAAMIGMPRDAIVGRNCQDFICPSQKGICPIIDLGKTVDQKECHLVTQDNTEIPILKTVSKLNVGGRRYLLEGFLDISKQKKLEAQLQQGQKMEALGTLTGGIAHDFNNILGIILGNTELAQSMMHASDKAHARLEVTKDAILRAKKIVDQLLGYSRQTTAQKTAVDVSRLTEETIGLLRALIPASITIEQQVADDTVMVHANATQIHQALVNLCVNASHAVDPETGIIRLQVSPARVNCGEFDHFPKVGGGAYAEIIVSDNGHGIDPENEDRIFDPYFTTKEIGKGTGMGLAVVMGIVQDHGGAISIKSRPNQGTTVRMVLPLTNIERGVAHVPMPQEIPRGNAEKILFIDDEELLVTLGRDILKSLNYEVEGHVDASEAMDRFQMEPASFDLIITDMSMPKMSGARVVEEARRIRPGIPVIICSGYSENMNDVRAAELGCQYIQKPIEMKSFSKTVREALDRD
jgi:two-component system cell cycle sensor histidine kinase/response regulator CckA